MAELGFRLSPTSKAMLPPHPLYLCLSTKCEELQTSVSLTFLRCLLDCEVCQDWTDLRDWILLVLPRAVPCHYVTAKCRESEEQAYLLENRITNFHNEMDFCWSQKEGREASWVVSEFPSFWPPSVSFPIVLFQTAINFSLTDPKRMCTTPEKSKATQ